MMELTRRGLFTIGAALMLAGCSSSQTTTTTVTTETTSSGSAATTDTALDFDGTGYSDTGSLTFYLSTPGGNTENGNVPQIAVDPKVFGTGLSVNVEDGDGTICDIYIDGHKRGTMNAGRASRSIEFEDSDKTSGIHKVELVSSSDDGASIYKSAEYEVVITD